MPIIPRTYLLAEDYLGLRAVTRAVQHLDIKLMASHLTNELKNSSVSPLKPDLLLVALPPDRSYRQVNEKLIEQLITEDCLYVPLVFISRVTVHQFDRTYQWRRNTLYVDELAGAESIKNAILASLTQSSEI
jgi:DNA-binding transcriptional LysR family regulator